MATDAINATRIVRRQREVSEALAATTMPDLLKQLYANRNIEDPVELDYSLGHLLDYRQLKDIDRISHHRRCHRVGQPYRHRRRLRCRRRHQHGGDHACPAIFRAR